VLRKEEGRDGYLESSISVYLLLLLLLRKFEVPALLEENMLLFSLIWNKEKICWGIKMARTDLWGEKEV
jgi:hypothetical protein